MNSQLIWKVSTYEWYNFWGLDTSEGVILLLDKGAGLHPDMTIDIIKTRITILFCFMFISIFYYYIATFY